MLFLDPYDGRVVAEATEAHLEFTVTPAAVCAAATIVLLDSGVWSQR